MHLPLTIAALCTAALAQFDRIEVQEVLVDPVGPNAGAQQIELRNLDGLPVDLFGLNLVTSNNALVLPSVVVPGDGVVVLHLGAAGSNSPTDVYLPGAVPLQSSDVVALFRNQNHLDPNAITDFVSFGGGQQAIQVAVTAGIWPGTLDTVALPTVEGASIAHYADYLLGSREDPDAWFADTTPTLGTANDGAGFFAVGIGCFGGIPPSFTAWTIDDRPWIGRTWQLQLIALPSTASTMLLALGVDGPFQQLSAIGMSNCFSTMTPFAITPFPVGPNAATIPVPVPNLPVLVSFEFRMQAFVDGYPNANPAGVLATRTMLVRPGSR